jgi:CheY-like chemotaxis protein
MLAMESKTELLRQSNLNVLLMGNNPIEMGNMLEKLNQIRGSKIVTEIAFDLKSLTERLLKFRPNYILIDDNIGKSELSQAVNALSQKSRTRNIPIAVLKNSNYHESIETSTILDYLLKANLSSERLYNTLKNAIRLRRTQIMLQKAFRMKKETFKFSKS